MVTAQQVYRMLGNFADVVELIAARNLDGSFARLIHKSLRPTFRELVRHATAVEDD